MFKTKVQLIEILSDDEGRRLDHFLFSKFQNIPKSHFYRLLREGSIRVNKKRVKQNYHIKAGDILRIPPLNILAEKSVPRLLSSLAKTLSNSILYEDDNLLIINKPSGLAVHGGSGLSIDLIESMRQLRKDIHFMELVHRLDRDTSGCLIIAKKNRVLRELHELLRLGKVTKVYYALTMGHWAKKINVMEVSLKKNILKSGERIVRVDSSGKSAITEFHVEKEFERASFVEVRLKTGRTHQIRVHAKHAGHPIACDEKYGDKDFNNAMHKIGLNRLFLHACRVSFVLPSTGQRISVKAPLNKELQNILEKINTSR